MKKAVKTLVTFLTENHAESSARNDKYYRELNAKAPKAILLSCPQSMRSFFVNREELYTVESFGATVKTNEATLDYAVRTLGLPLLCIMGHDHCDALNRAVKADHATEEEAALYAYIAAGFSEGTAKEPKRTLHHIDREVAAALSRYGDLVKTEKLVVVGLYCDEAGQPFLTNYNGLKGKEALAYSLPEVDEGFFMA